MNESHYISAEIVCMKAYNEKFNSCVGTGKSDIRQMSRDDLIDFYLQAWALFVDLKPDIDFELFQGSCTRYHDIALSILCDRKSMEMYKRFHELTKDDKPEKIKSYLARNGINGN